MASFIIDKLDNTNYNTWAVMMKSVLIQGDLWAVVCGRLKKEGSIEDQNAFDIKDEKALANILLYVKPNQIIHIKNCKTSKEAWAKLDSIHSPKGPSTKIRLTKKLLQLKMSENCNAADHINQFSDLVDKLTEIGGEMTEETKTILLLNSLSIAYEAFVIAIESRETLPNLNTLKVKILEEGDRQAAKELENESERESETKVFASTVSEQTIRNKHYNNRNKPNNKNDKTCYTCGRTGHFAAQCRSKNKKKKSNGAVVLTSQVQSLKDVTTNKFNQNAWCIDSGATSHLCCNKKYFTNYVEKSDKIQLAGNKYILAAGYGEVRTKFGEVDVVLKDAIFVPSLKNNFISISKIIKNGAKCVFENKCVKIIKNSKVILTADETDGLYIAIDNYKDEPNACFLVKSTIWHNRFGHLNYEALREMHNQKMVLGLEKIQKPETNCVICAKGKICVKPFPKESMNRSNEILNLVHSDICGPMSIKSHKGNMYFATFIDDMSRYIFVYFLRSKDEIFDAFVEFKTFAERQTEKKLKAIITDNAREYTSNKFENYLKNNGIKRFLTVPYTPQQNGVAERANRTLVEMARCLLLQANLKEPFWADAIHTAVYLRNRSYTTSLNKITPYEAWVGRKPYISHLKVFGSRVVVLDKKNRRKFQQKGIDNIIIGYSDTAKAYRLFNPTTKRFSEGRDIIVVEEKIEDKSENTGINLVNETIDNEDNSCRGIKILKEQFDEKDEKNNNTEDEKNENTEDEKNEITEIKLINETTVNEDDKTHEETIENDEYANENQDGNNEVSKRGPGRPKILKTGLKGRPKKQYNTVNLLNASDIFIPQTVEQAELSEEQNFWKIAMQEEFDALIKNDTWSLQRLPNGNTTIGCRWIFTVKPNPDGSVNRFKARLVAKGCSQEKGINYSETFSPVVRYSTIRFVIAIAAEKGLYLHQMDVISAYLNSTLDENIYMKQPKGFVNEQFPDYVLKLKKSLYGLKQAGRMWNLKLDEILKNLDFLPTWHDPCLYKHSNDPLCLIAVYVDDLLLTSKSIEKLTEIKRKIAMEIDVVDKGEAKFFLGIEINQFKENNKIQIHQTNYIKNIISRYNMFNSRKTSTPLPAGFQVYCDNEKCRRVDVTSYQKIIGELLYLAILTRPDIAHSINKLSQRCKDPHSEHEAATKHVLRYLRETWELKLTFRKTDKNIFGYVDADWANDGTDRKSYSGYVFFCAGAVFSWETRKQPTVALSSTEAEYIALSTAAKEATYLKHFLIELNAIENNRPIEVYGDNLGAQHLAKNPVYHARTKHIDVKVHHIREVLKRGDMHVEYISTTDMVADILTKNLTKVKHEKFCKMMGLE